MGDLLAEGVTAGYVIVAQRPGFGQLAAGVRLAGQQVGGCRAARLPGQTHVQNRLDLIQPRHFHGTAAEQHHDGVGVGGGHGFNQAVVTLGHSHGFTVKTLGLINIGQTCADHGNFCLAGGFGGFAQTFLGHSTLDITARHKGRIGQSVAQGGQLCGVDMARPRALIPHGARHLADKGDIAPVQRQDVAFVFQKHCAVFGDFLRQCVVGILVKGLAFGASFTLQRQRNHTRRTGIYIAFGQAAVLNGGGDPVLHIIAAARHTQIAPGVHGLDAVAEGAPVGDDQAFKAPVTAQYLGQQPGIVTGVDVVDARIAAHNGLGLCVFDNSLKRGQIQLPHRALVHLTVAVEPLVLLVVGGKVLQAGTRAAALRALHPCRAHSAGNAGVLGKILKVASAQRVALDVDAGTQHHVHTVRKPFLTDGLALGFKQRGVPGCAACHGSGKAGRRLGLVDAQHIGAVFLAAHAMGTVTHRDGGDAVLLHCLAVPEIRTIAKADFLLQRHF